MGFNLADVLKDVPELDTGREQIEYIRLDLIDGDAENFYSLSEIESLANNISTIGLQQPLRLRKHPSEEGRYLVVSGHRRREALMVLAKEDPGRWSEAACIVQRDTVSPAMQQLRLIFANSDTRKMSSADISEQAVQVEKLLYQLKEEGHEFPGRMRDHVAQVVQVSKSKLARLKVIRENLADVWQNHYKTNALVESTAYALAQMPKDWQEFICEHWGEKPRSLYEDYVKEFMRRMSEIQKLRCEIYETGCCRNFQAMMLKSCKDRWTNPCGSGCCIDCPNLRTCGSSCPQAKTVKKIQREQTRDSRIAEAEAKVRAEKPTIDFIKGVYNRIGIARKASAITPEAFYKAKGESYYSTVDDPKLERLENGTAAFRVETPLPFGHSFYYTDAAALCRVADTLNCSVDYLLGRTERMELVSDPGTTLESKADVSRSGAIWQTGEPAEEGAYLLRLSLGKHCDNQYEEWVWDGCQWHDDTSFYDPVMDGEILGWIPMPNEPEKAADWNNHSCITGMSPTGHCGAAACCSTEYACCLQCPEPCNSQCGWISEQAEVLADE